jgi:hypothetical protein
MTKRRKSSVAWMGTAILVLALLGWIGGRFALDGSLATVLSGMRAPPVAVVTPAVALVRSLTPQQMTRLREDRRLTYWQLSTDQQALMRQAFPPAAARHPSWHSSLVMSGKPAELRLASDEPYRLQPVEWLPALSLPGAPMVELCFPQRLPGGSTAMNPYIRIQLGRTWAEWLRR